MTSGRPLRGLLAAQFLGAFNDNAWKMIVTLLAIAVLDPSPSLDAASQVATTRALVIFTLPLMLFSLPAGLLADRYSKRSVIVAMKGFEVALMAAATIALAVAPGGGWLTLATLGLLGLQSALFSPAKYGILPELLPHERLVAGNGQLELWTFLAIIAGTASGGPLLKLCAGRPWIAGLVLTFCAAAGLLASLTVPRTEPASRSQERLRESVRGAWLAVRADRVLWLAVLGNAFFWLLASLLGQDILVYSKSILKLGDDIAGLPMALFGVGVGAGSVLAGRMSRGKVEYGLIPLGSILLAALTLVLGWVAPAIAGTLVLMAALGIASGLIVVPIESILQWRAPASRRGGVIALANVFVFTGVLFGSLGALAMSSAGLSSRGIMIGAAIATLAATVWAIRLLPLALLRLVLVLITHTFYRLRVIDRQQVPEQGGALLVPNHVSFVDGLLMLASIDRPIRFLVDEGWFSRPLIRPFMKILGAIPISAGGGPRATLRALRNAGEELDRGELVCIFAEGEITRTGGLLPFRRGLERIVKGRTVNVIPVYMDGVWGSIFSRSGGHFLWKLPRQIPYPVTVAYGPPLPSTTPFHQVRQAVTELASKTAQLKRADARPLHHEFVTGVRRRPFAFAFADLNRPRVSRLKALTSSIALARELGAAWQGQERVGCLMPASVGGALVNLAASLGGRTIVNLNYTVGVAGLESAMRQAGLKKVVTSATFLAKAGVQLPSSVTAIELEQLAKQITWWKRTVALSIALFCPRRWIERACGAPRATCGDDLATVIFSSGSTGEPKGVMLSHFNISSNVEAVCQVVQLYQRDRILGILPFFHSFGYLVLWASARRGFGSVFHPNPLDGEAVGELVERYHITFLLATPTFLQLYLRRCTPGQFGSLRFVLVGAEKLPERLAQAFTDRFGLRPLEGYGATECSPVIALSTPGFRSKGFYQSGSRRGFVGQPVPGVSLRLVDPDTHAPVAPGESGLLLVKGPNIMQGYLGRDDLTQKALRDGWYITGDMARLDEDGFLQITDRLARFSKIGGEMVPHGRVEEALHEAAQVSTQVFAVTAIPDERKGERLAVLHTLADDQIRPILEKVAATGLPNLFIPRPDSFVKVPALPVLGTGKIDLRAVKQVASEALANRE